MQSFLGLTIDKVFHLETLISGSVSSRSSQTSYSFQQLHLLHVRIRIPESGKSSFACGVRGRRL